MYRIIWGMVLVLGSAGMANGQAPGGGPSVANASAEGSLLIFPAVEVKWDRLGRVKFDTILSITNDTAEDVYVQIYMVNGDDPLPETFLERAHPGWNWADCQLPLTPDQPTYWSAATGLQAGCQPFSVLDDAGPLGRPNLEDSIPRGRVLRGYFLAWAVNVLGEEISWNHLSGSATVVDYDSAVTWEYPAYAFRAINRTDRAQTDGFPGELRLDGFEYDSPYDRLLLQFQAVGARFDTGISPLTVDDLDISLLIVPNDLRQDGFGPITTKAKYDIWNQNERRLSGTEYCLTCWDQRLVSSFDVPNNALVQNLQTDVGKARIDGIASTLCDESPDCVDPQGQGGGAGCSTFAPLLGVAGKLYSIGGLASSDAAAAGSTLVGLGQESATIRYDIVRAAAQASPPQSSSPPSKGVGSLSEELGGGRR
ncbi:MAG: hypothetical protein ACE5GE_04070 [Phycisphaerae bacterium]